MPTLPIVCRVDGKAFHSFTKGLDRPFDKGLSDLMLETTKFLVQETAANFGYIQSDEISLVWYNKDPDHQLFFDGKTQKIVSITASMATYFFNKNLEKYLPSKKDKIALFDSRCWNVPNPDEVVIYTLWRQKDATKNAITMAASTVFSHAELQGVHGGNKQEMLYSKGVNFNDYPTQFKRGSFVRKTKVNIAFSASEIEKLPLQHEARKNPNLLVERSILETSHYRLTKISNKIDFLLNGQEPILEDKTDV